MNARAITCTYHCSACGLHLHSVHAFDAHRIGDYASNDPEARRRCEHPWDMAGRLVPLSGAGECRVYDDGSGNGVNHNVTVWADARDIGRMRRHVAAGASGEADSAHEAWRAAA
jgi:hypothetical protein